MFDEISIEPTDKNTAKILICHMIFRLERDVLPSELFEICVSGGVINYFLYTESIDELIENRTIIKTEKNGETYFSLTEKGRYGAEDFKRMVPKSIRDRALGYAMKYYARKKAESDVECEFIEVENGWYIRCRFKSVGSDLLDMKLYAPDLDQAELIKEKILANPTAFYSNLITYVTDNVEPEFDVS